MFSCEFRDIFKNNFFTKHPRMTASVFVAIRMKLFAQNEDSKLFALRMSWRFLMILKTNKKAYEYILKVCSILYTLR